LEYERQTQRDLQTVNEQFDLLQAGQLPNADVALPGFSTEPPPASVLTEADSHLSAADGGNFGVVEISEPEKANEATAEKRSFLILFRYEYWCKTASFSR